MSKILIVDDEAPIRQLLSIMCKGAGHHVDAAENGLEATYLVQRENYDLLITDMSMSPLSGGELVKFVRTASPQTRIVALSGWSAGDVQSLTEEAGVDRYMSKPFNRDQVVAVINELSYVN